MRPCIPCISCGTPSTSTRCPDCQPAREQQRGTARERGYDAAWTRLSARARRLQPFCTDCGSVEQLSADHTPEAWQRRAEGKVIRLEDVAVLCSPCNNRRGAARGPLSSRQAATRGENPLRNRAGTLGERKSRLHTEVMPSRQAVQGRSSGPLAAGRAAVGAVSPADDVTATDGTGPGGALHHRLQSSAQEAGAGLGFPQRLDPERELSTVELVEVRDRDVAASRHHHDVVHPAVRVVAQSPGHVTTVPVTDDIA